MNFPKGYTGLYIMLGAALVFALFGYLILKKNINTAPPTTQTQTQSQAEPTPEPPPPAPADDLAGWQTYTNTKYDYELKYPPNLKVGSISGNSVLGDFQHPVLGFDVGPLVLVSLKGDMRKTGADYFNESYNLALHPLAPAAGQPTESCTVDKINNPNVGVKSVSCNGEGGAARYALIVGKDYDVFVDGYSKGFDNTNNGEFADPNDYVKILGSFKFHSNSIADQPFPLAGADTDPNPTPAPTPAAEPPPQAVQSFSVNADDNSATPSEITVPKGTIVDLTFNVSAQNVYYGGLDFRSSLVNTGTIQAGASKTVAFTANESFSFTPYWPSGNVQKDYKIKITVQ